MMNFVFLVIIFCSLLFGIKIVVPGYSINLFLFFQSPERVQMLYKILGVC